MRTLYDVPAPAKLNLFLHITGRRADGYHLLQSVFMLIDWADELHFELQHSGAISREDLNVSLPADDLITRAAKALQQATGCQQGVHIGVRKNLPAQAGMGGGSSDAASTLLALNQLWNLKLSRGELQRIALQLGADVPFFIFGKSAWVEGIGDIIRPLENEQQLADTALIVVKPQEGLDTKLIFSSPNLKRDSKAATISDFAAKHFDFGRNDLQPVAEGLCPSIKKVSDFLKSQGLHARMTGSGSAVFAVKKTQAFSCQSSFSQDWTVKDCKSLTEHPLIGWAQD
ncbi:4-(cytidine 5'-diphospho)-2-C-methyl-D-erythritol kinase [Comamonas sp. J-3]|uniref:4-(cytidine 5'-diphospho)-2-C-methyl-D-erythritol kinase n=1 Tax=Comamonas trifloxystrobinivorans TaxID=3350256 RepID=UPI003728BEFC